jgi:hypothetical protein
MAKCFFEAGAKLSHLRVEPRNKLLDFGQVINDSKYGNKHKELLNTDVFG